MSKKLDKSNPVLVSLIHKLKKQSNEEDVDIWKDVADRLARPSKNWPEVHLYKIDKHVNKDETALVPGKVLSTGDLSKEMSVAAWSASEKAKKKIKESGSKYMSIEQLMEDNPKGKNIRILG